MSIEAEFVNAFVVKEKRNRYRDALSSPRKRRNLLDRLNHRHDFEPRFISVVPQGTTLEGWLCSKRAGNTCYVFADGHELDGQSVLLHEALEATREFAFVLILEPKRLAVYWPEAPAQPRAN